ncbi:uncharacterized protein ABDE67_001233 isoform 2-T2 [Symphorus nematophorus]
MQSTFLLQVLFALSSLILSKARNVFGSSASCLSSSSAEDGLTRVTFLHEDAVGLRSLYLSMWSEDMRLVTCEVNTDPLVTERYRALCDRSGTRDQEITKSFNISVLLAPEAPCALVSSSAPGLTTRDVTEEKVRRKRSWIFPGTLWCGTGSSARGYEELGMFESADRCCRAHDHCPHIIPSFTMNYGIFNSKFFTVSHCDCDQRFRQCLLAVNDTISSMVGYSFFSILQVPCFELKQQRRCTEMYMFGMCKKANNASYAVFKSPLPYNTTDVTDSNKLTSSDGQNVTESPMVKPLTKSPRSKHRCSSKDSSRGDTFSSRRTKGKGCKRHRKLYTSAPSQIPSTSRPHNTTSSIETSLLHTSTSSTLMSNERRAGRKKSTRKGQSASPTQVQPQVTTVSFLKTTSTTQGTPFTTQKPPPQLPTAITAVNKSTKSHKKVPKQSPCCGFRIPPRGDTFQPPCESCQEQNMTTVEPSTLPIKKTTLERLQFKKTMETPKQDAWKTPWGTATSAIPATTKPKTTASIHALGKPGKQMDSQEPRGRTKAPNTHAERGLKLNIALYNMTENQLLCRSLKHLDRCTFKIPPLEKKYDLQNMESKTAYHCDCTSSCQSM